MVFSSPTFLFAFLPGTLLVLALMPSRRWQNAWLLVASVVFYIWGAGAAVLVLAGVTLIAWLIGLAPWGRFGTSMRRGALGGSIAVLLVPLFLYKYLPVAGAYAGSTLFVDWVLPLGISFFTFHAISYVADRATGRIEEEANLADFALYLFVFPHQIAGPIVRYSEIRESLHQPRGVSLGEFGYGLSRFSWGLAKKVLVADPCGRAVDELFTVFGHLPVSGTDAWAAAILFTIQIYFDFSAYSDMAIGLARMLGFRFPENFDQPYRSASVSEFWRRWHMTLTRWFRDYIYIPLGGNRHGRGREYLALVIVFALTSLWHGAEATFLLWGALHSAALLLERATGLREWRGWRALRRILTLLFIVISFVPFRAPDLTVTWSVWTALVAPATWAPSPFLLSLQWPWLVVPLLAAFAVVGPGRRTGFAWLSGTSSSGDLSTVAWVRLLPVCGMLFAVAAAVTLWSDFSPFLYFRF